MQNIEWWQIILLTLFSGYAFFDGNGPTLGFVKPTMAGFVAGLIMGDIQTGLFIGGTLNLLILGVGNFGGASIPDYMTGAVLGTAFAVMSGESPEVGVTLAIPIGLLMIQLDILARFTNVYFQKKAEKLVDEGKLKKASNMNLLGLIPNSLSRMLPVFLALVLGSAFVQDVVNAMPTWLMDGLGVAGGILPALGIAILLRYMPIKQNIAFLLVGIFLAAYLEVPIMGIAIIGFAMAVLFYQSNKENNSNKAVSSEGVMGDE